MGKLTLPPWAQTQHNQQVATCMTWMFAVFQVSLNQVHHRVIAWQRPLQVIALCAWQPNSSFCCNKTGIGYEHQNSCLHHRIWQYGVSIRTPLTSAFSGSLHQQGPSLHKKGLTSWHGQMDTSNVAGFGLPRWREEKGQTRGREGLDEAGEFCLFSEGFSCWPPPFCHCGVCLP